jgi:diguanylate cyclase
MLAEHRRASRLQSSLALIMFDIDHFKLVNDTHGHLGGDACLRALAKLMRARIHRAGDVLARYGGEEFVMLLLDSSLEDAVALAEEFRADIENLKVEFDGDSIRFTASFGVTCGIPNGHNSPQDFLASADKALYQAKHDGRNCVRSAAVASHTG